MSKILFNLFIMFYYLINYVTSQSTSDCGSSVGCFKYPAGCSDSACTYIYKWTYQGYYHNFTLFGKPDATANRWLAIGFSKDTFMGDDSVVICRTSGAVWSYYNPTTYSHAPPVILNNAIQSFGLSNSSVKINNGWIQCSFNRQLTLNLSNYFDLSNNFYIMAAYGSVDPTDTLIYHTDKRVSDNMVNFTQNAIAAGVAAEDFNRLKAHGCLMVIAWIFCASTGIIIARYYKFLLPTVKICKFDFWFNIHRPLMLLVVIISVVGLIVILSFRNWTWVTTDEPVIFAHSIFGIVTISLAVLQPFIARTRPHKDGKYRFIFNWVHRSVGLFALLFSIVALFLASVIDEVGLGDNGWGILAGWTVWVICYPALLEIIELYMFNPREAAYTLNQEQTEKPKPQRRGERIKKILLFAHLTVSLAFTVALVVLIGIAENE